MTTLYGSSKSRAARSLWALEELGVKYDHVPVAPAEAKSADNLKRNPNGHVPVLEDDGIVVWESMAINLYLAEKYGKNSLWPSDLAGHAAAYKWSFFGMTEAEPHLMSILRNRVMNPPDKRDENAALAAVEALKAPFKVLDQSLQGREYLLGNSFTIADLNVASVLSWAAMIRLDQSATPTAQAWLQKCLGREANAKVRKLP
ncbi:MAG: glutathione S-transferase family protein [Candidatus Binatus sp.]|uniref:glutathione S-transferase family protein n=1 Tax=Candidatus Binatus sp. TaxID=2811406 RepID=UPI002725B390|nr:glutathione S-transferase family protein [Candidatus Binatus sp.]MDO8432743.1 glutathione S-transferase family protein [Candidatus Binatus sp.]